MGLILWKKQKDRPCYNTNRHSAGGRNPICSMTCSVFRRYLQIYLWSHGLTFKFSHKDLLSLPWWSFIWYKTTTKKLFLSACIFYITCRPRLDFFLFFLFPIFLIKMAPSWTAGAWTLLAALGLLSCCSFGWCEASRTSGSTSGGSKQEQGPSSLERVKRGWVWNQFFVVEEYTGTEPLYVGKVRHLILWCKMILHKTKTVHTRKH